MPDAREQAEAVWSTLFPWPETQCPVCGFTYSDRPTGCRPGDCSLRPTPERKSCEAPPLESCLNFMRKVEDEIERRGLCMSYRRHLLEAARERAILLWHSSAEPTPFDRWEEYAIATASALQRLAAAARVIEEGKQ